VRPDRGCQTRSSVVGGPWSLVRCLRCGWCRIPRDFRRRPLADDGRQHQPVMSARDSV